MAKPSEKLIARLVAEGHLEPGQYRLERTYAGYWQRTAGAFSWYITDSRGVDVGIGSQWTVREVLAAPEWVFGSYGAIYPGPINDGLQMGTIRQEPADSSSGGVS
ncbi:hypothetical protein IC744_06905 [Microbacterium hominis]|uniref:hypothetical protein n=1 Tax=Microbacterium hominis TaxID=162426 RepID=UPI00168B84B6|nr:hypothetical protein [Microbacterium hominis]QOC26076.1 hypothetical protein IC745_01225 [Microbacterium hominis]QOC30047.1 hypothetical protein IC744_06905 [Microbacterium hominis]